MNIYSPKGAIHLILLTDDQVQGNTQSVFLKNKRLLRKYFSIDIFAVVDPEAKENTIIFAAEDRIMGPNTLFKLAVYLIYLVLCTEVSL